MRTLFVSSLALTIGILPVAVARDYPLNEKVVVAERMIHPVRVGANGMTASERVTQINERLVTIIAVEPLHPSNIRIRMVGDDPAIYVGRHLVTTVTEADAAANRMSKIALARMWLARYRRWLPQARPGARG